MKKKKEKDKKKKRHKDKKKDTETSSDWLGEVAGLMSSIKSKKKKTRGEKK